MRFAIALRSTDRLIGGIGLDGTAGRLAPGEAALGYWLGAPFCGRGYGREAARAVIAWGFGALCLATIRAATAPDNEASIGLLETCGFDRTGTLDEAAATVGTPGALVLFALARRDFEVPPAR